MGERGRGEIGVEGERERREWIRREKRRGERSEVK